MLIIGLTGSIGMGKSTAAALFRSLGIPVHDADAAVHALYKGAAVTPVDEAFPGVVIEGVIDRAALARVVLGNPEALARLEAIVHPLVAEHRKAFMAPLRASGRRIIVFDVPLLFETGGAALCDLICVVSASFDVQKQRVLSRPDMTEEKFQAILSRQVHDKDKRAHAHIVIDSGRGFDAMRGDIAALVRSVASMPGRRKHEHEQHGSP